MKRYQKILLGTLIIILVILGGIQIYLSFFLDDQLEETAVTRFHEATDDKYELTIGDLDLWVPGRKLSVSGIEITPKEKNTGIDIRAHVDDLNISGIGVLNYLISQDLNLDQIEFVNPRIYITSPEKSQNGGNTDPVAMSQKLSETVLQELNSLSISDFSIHGLSANLNRADLPSDTLLSFNNCNINLYNIHIDSTSLKNNRILPADDLSMTFRDIRHQTTNGLYTLSADQMEFSSAGENFTVDSMRLDPKFERVEFANQAGYEIDRITLGLDQIKGEGIDIERLNRSEGIFSQQIAIKNADLDVYHDKRPPSGPKNRPPLPHQMLSNIPFPFSVDSIFVENSNIRYIEHHPEAPKPGYIEFADLSATFQSVSNDKKRWKEGDRPTLHAETQVMGESQLSVDFTFATTDSLNTQQIRGALQPMDMQPLNETLVPLAFIRIDDGRILKLTFEMILGEKHAGGKVILEYENFEVSLLDKELSEEAIGKELLTFLANSLKIKSENTGEDLRIAEVDFERDEGKSTFNYWWKSLLSGLKSSIGF